MLRAQNIPVIVLKGAHLVELVYEDMGARRIRDIDLLVKKEDLPGIDQELLAYGCKPWEYHRIAAPEDRDFHYSLPKTNLRLEIHWTLISGTYPAVIDIEGIWAGAQPATLAHAPVLVMSPEDLVLHLCLHVVHHAGEMGISMLLDFEPVVRCAGAQLNWEELAARARQWGIVRAVYVVLRLARELLEVPVPKAWLVSLQPPGFDQHDADLLREQLLGGHGVAQPDQLGSVYLPQLWGSKSVSEKLAMIRDRVFLPREKMATLYPAPAHSLRLYLYYPVRAKDLLMRFGGAAWRLVRGDRQTHAMAKKTNEITALREWLLSSSGDPR